MDKTQLGQHIILIIVNDFPNPYLPSYTSFGTIAFHPFHHHVSFIVFACGFLKLLSTEKLD